MSESCTSPFLITVHDAEAYIVESEDLLLLQTANIRRNIKRLGWQMLGSDVLQNCLMLIGSL